MKKCPFCAEEVQDEAIVCKHCGREIVPLQPVARANPQSVQQPPANIPVNPKISLAIQKYTKADYKVTSAFGNSANLERPATKFNWWVFWMLILFFIPGILVQLVVYFVWLRRRSYQVQLVVGPDEQVQELGDTIEVYEEDMLHASQNRYKGFGIVLCSLGGLVFLLTLLALITGPADTITWSQHITSFTVIFVFFSLLTTLPGTLCLRKAYKITQQPGKTVLVN